jgi:hypothetical protein
MSLKRGGCIFQEKRLQSVFLTSQTCPHGWGGVNSDDTIDRWKLGPLTCVGMPWCCQTAISVVLSNGGLEVLAPLKSPCQSTSGNYLDTWDQRCIGWQNSLMDLGTTLFLSFMFELFLGLKKSHTQINALLLMGTKQDSLSQRVYPLATHSPTQKEPAKWG